MEQWNVKKNNHLFWWKSVVTQPEMFLDEVKVQYFKDFG